MCGLVERTTYLLLAAGRSIRPSFLAFLSSATFWLSRISRQRSKEKEKKDGNGIKKEKKKNFFSAEYFRIFPFFSFFLSP